MRVPELAHVAGLSRFHLSRVFQAHTGESLADFARRIRLERAAHRLQYTNSSVAELAYEAGYSNGESFSRAFRHFFGCCPTDYRDERSGDWRLKTPSHVHWAPDGELPALAPKNVDSEIALVSLKKLRLAAFRHIGDWRQIGPHWLYVRRVVHEHFPGLTQPRLFTIHYDNVRFVPVHRIRTDLAVLLPLGASLPMGWHNVDVPSGAYATTSGFVPSSQYRSIWQQMEADWIPSSGQRPAVVPTFEEYPEWPMPWDRARLRAFVGLDMEMVVPR